MTISYQYSIHFIAILVYMLLLAVYLLCSSRNAFGKEVVTNQQLRREAGLLILVYWLIYVANVPLTLLFDETTGRILSLSLDVLVGFPLIFRFMLMLLQDRRRWDNRLWWFALPVVAAVAVEMFTEFNGWIWLLLTFLVESVFFVVNYMRGVREYNRFLKDNYADLERKQVKWSPILLLALAFGDIFYIVMHLQTSPQGMVTWSYVFHLIDMVFVTIIVWQVDRRQVLATPAKVAAEMDDSVEEIRHNAQDVDVNINKVGKLLDQHCVASALYLQHGLTLDELAKACGTSRTYLTLYFSSMGIKYFDYINAMRIQHFQQKYKEARKHPEAMPALFQLTAACGFSSPDAFSQAFLASEGISFEEWEARQKA